jgi:hypothetical protein
MFFIDDFNCCNILSKSSIRKPMYSSVKFVKLSPFCSHQYKFRNDLLISTFFCDFFSAVVTSVMKPELNIKNLISTLILLTIYFSILNYHFCGLNYHFCRFGSVGQDTLLCLWDLTEVKQSFALFSSIHVCLPFRFGTFVNSLH